MKARRVLALSLAVITLGACSLLPKPETPAPAATVHPGIWPKLNAALTDPPELKARVADLLSKMTVEEKVGQTIQADIASVTPDDVRTYHLGSILNGGNSGPGGNDRALPPDWLKAADAYYEASLDVPVGHVAIPVIWGSDSVHGNSNIIGATIFPHNIGLGAANDPDLLRKIGEITAIETRIAGQDWTFAPTLAVVRDIRWGRTYESYSENPDIVRTYAGAMVQGIQGVPGTLDFLRGAHIIATIKHFLADGGTDKGHDQGDSTASEEDLRDIHSAGYQSGIVAGVQVVMASYSSWLGQKMHGNQALLHDVLIDRFGFDGFVVSDWNAHGQLPGCTVTDCPGAVLAGIDMLMAPDSWKGLYASTLAEVRSGAIPMARLDEAVARILRVKLRAGVFDAGKPSSRPYGGKWDELASPAHRAVARQAVRESLVLLKNEHALLPLSPKLNVLVTGSGADDMSKQTGGWTISWQGAGNSRADFPRAQTIFEGIAEQVRAAGGQAALSPDASFGAKPDVAIVVFGEDPYAEFMGDRDTLAFEPGDPRDLRLIRDLKAKGIPVVAVFLSGRPLYVTREINAADAFVAAWLPGTEGGGVADLLFRQGPGKPAFDFRGRLSFSWPRAPEQAPLHLPGPNATAAERAAYNPLFAFGYGLDFAHPRDLGVLPEAPGGDVIAANVDHYLDNGRAAPPWTLSIAGADGSPSPVLRLPAATPELALASSDHLKQEDTLTAKWSGNGAAALVLSGAPIDLSRQANGDMALRLTLRVDAPPTGPVTLEMRCGVSCHGSVDLTDALRAGPGMDWKTIDVRLSCLGRGANMAAIAAPFVLATSSRFAVSITSVALVPGEGPPSCPAPPQS